MALRSSCPPRHRLEIVAARKARAAKQVAVSRTLVAKKGHEAQVASLAGEILKWTANESQVAEKGIVAFDCVRDGWDANTFHFWERYENPSSFGAHSTAPKMMELLQQLQPHLEGPIGIALYSYENGRLGPSSIQAGPKGEGGLDDATGASGAAGGASYKQTSRAFDLTKINEHEEAEREQQLLASFGPGGQQAQAGPGQHDGDSADKQGSGRKSRGLAGLPDVVAMAVNLKNQVVGSLCRLLRH